MKTKTAFDDNSFHHGGAHGDVSVGDSLIWI
jgi:hypothetical protein